MVNLENIVKLLRTLYCGGCRNSANCQLNITKNQIDPTLSQIEILNHFFSSDCTPESIFASQAEHQVDLQRKLQEDPLISLKMREVDTRKKILDNPLKMKQINDYVSFLLVYNLV